MSNVTIEPTSHDLRYWASRPYLRKETQERLRLAEVVLVPREGFRDEEIRSFPVRTEEFHKFMQEKVGDRHRIDVAIEDEEYKELALHSALIELGAVVATVLVAPIIANIISDYINRRAEAAAKKEEARVRFEMTVVEQTEDAVRAVNNLRRTNS